MLTTTFSRACSLILFSGLAACGSSDSNSKGTSDLDPEIPCAADNCGESRFRSAVPSRDTVRIQFAGASQNFINPESNSSPTSGIGSTRQALEALSPELAQTEAYVGEINSIVDGLFETFEELASTTPEEESEFLHAWRQISEDDPNVDEILVVTAIDDNSYTIELVMGEAGIAIEEGFSVVSGEVHLDDNEDKTDFEITIDLDAASSVIGGLDSTGAIVLSAQPLDGGLREVWYDFDAVGGIDGPTETSRTTYWNFDATSSALEFVGEEHEELTTIFVRWDEGGGRYDHHVEWESPDFGIVDEIATNCWDESGAELFDGFALIDSDLSYFGEVDGDEEDCDFGPVDGHPNPSSEFANLPAEGEWQELEFGDGGINECQDDPFAVGCPPLCDDEPSDPDCAPWCDEEPSNPNCIEYCDWVDDPEFCQ